MLFTYQKGKFTVPVNLSFFSTTRLLKTLKQTIGAWQPNSNYPFLVEGYRMIPCNLKVLVKFGLCSNCSQKLDDCSLARARKLLHVLACSDVR